MNFELRQRAYDGKWERLEKVLDPENAYTYKTETGNHVTMTPDRWVCTKVYDYIGEIDE